jgi:hypothetical protein
MVGAVQGLERLMQGGDGGGVEGVLLFRPVEGDEDDAAQSKGKRGERKRNSCNWLQTWSKP